MLVHSVYQLFGIRISYETNMIQVLKIQSYSWNKRFEFIKNFVRSVLDTAKNYIFPACLLTSL